MRKGLLGFLCAVTACLAFHCSLDRVADCNDVGCPSDRDTCQNTTGTWQCVPNDTPVAPDTAVPVDAGAATDRDI